ncbi:MAG TPA: B12-binding domain-containing protein [Bdellovibrionales bacterium]|nr:B12-binding domain-containing protein [Bdellovibrionales bacterium]
MLRWCAYCQRFEGEVPPFETYDVTHGLCARCKDRGLEISDAEMERVQNIKAFQSRLWEAGRSGDQSQAESLLGLSLQMGLRPIDTLVGLVTPALWRVGRLWEERKMTVFEEHRFTAFCEQLLALVALKTPAVSGGAPVLLLPAEGNIHTLGARMMHIWLSSLEQNAHCVFPGIPVREAASLVWSVRPAVVGVSISMPDQLPQALELEKKLKDELGPECPPVVVGGFPVKMGRVAGSQPRAGESSAQMLIRLARERSVENFGKAL